MSKDIIRIKDIIVIDCEASGLSEKSYPIEVGVALHDDTFGFLIKPEPKWTHWGKKAALMHQISRDELEDGKSAHDAALYLNSQLRDNTVYSDASAYEIFWLDKLFKSAKIDRLFDIDSIYSLPFDVETYKKEKKKLSSFIITHRAENDSYIIRESLIKALLDN